MIDADTIKNTILEITRKSDSPVALKEIAGALDPINPEDLQESIRLVAEVMELQGLVSLKDGSITLSEKYSPDSP